MKILQVNNIWSRCDIDSIKELKKFLSYEAEYWKRSAWGRKRILYQRTFVGKTGFFFSGFIPLIKEEYPDAEIQLCKQKIFDIRQITSLGDKVLRDYQKSLLQASLKEKRGVLKSPTGSGKTLVEASVIASIPEARSLVIVHTKTLLSQIRKDIGDLLDEEIGIVGDGKEIWKKVTVGMIQTLSKMEKRYLLGRNLNIVIVDECFAKGTKILTPFGNRNIEGIKIGDFIYSKNGIDKVTHIFKNRIALNRVIKVKFSNGIEIFCSKEELFYSNGNWIPIEKGIKKDFTFSQLFIIFNIMSDFILNKEISNVQNLSDLQKGIHCKKKSKNLFFQVYGKSSKNLFSQKVSSLWKGIFTSSRRNILFLRMHGKIQKNPPRCKMYSMRKSFSPCECWKKVLFNRMFPRIWDEFEDNEKNQFGKKKDLKQKNERTQSNVRQKNISENDEYKKNKWNTSSMEGRKGRKWKSFACATKDVGNSSRMGNRNCSPHKNEKRFWLSYLLQNRYRKQKNKTWNRSGWEQSSWRQKKKERQEKRRQTKGIWLEDIEIYKQGSNGRYFKSIISDKERDSGFVEFYDLEVESSHSYFANGFLVHNCHHALAATYSHTISSINAQYRLGYSATPKDFEDEKGEYLKVIGLLGPIIHTIEFNDIKEYLAIPIIEMIEYQPNWNIEGMDWRNAYRYGIEESEERNEAIRNCIEYLKGSILIMVKTVRHGDFLQAKIFGSHFVQGKDKIEVRDKIKEVLKSNKEKVTVIATDVFGEGVDVPNLDVVILAGGGKTKIGTVQHAGRVLRKTDEKQFGVIIDFWDEGNKYLARHSQERYSIYQKLGWVK